MTNRLTIKILLIASFAIFLFVPIKILAAGLVINEVMYDPAGTDANHEWIELYNSGAADIDLTDYKFNDGDNATNHGLNAPPKNGSRGSLIIQASGYLILAGNAETVIADLASYSGSTIDTVMNLSNTSSALKVFDKDNGEVASANYAKTMGAAGNGKTLEWDGSTFHESYRDGGTPGAPNSVLSEIPVSSPPAQTPNATSSGQTYESSPQDASDELSYENYSDKVFINEFMPWPDDGKEWVELINTNDATIDLSAWQIDDGPEGSASQGIPEGTLIQPNDLIVIELNKDILNNSGDQLRFLWPDGQTTHSISYKNAKQGLSSARFGTGLWLWTNQPTPGQPNKKSNASTTQKTASVPPSAPVVLSEQVSEPVAQSEANVRKLSQTDKTSSSNLFASPTARQNSVTESNQPQKSASPPLFVLLGIITVLSLASGLGLVYFRRKTKIDNS